MFGQTRKQLELQRKKLNKEIKQVFDAMTYQSEVIFTGHIQAEDLKNVYGAGLALTSSFLAASFLGADFAFKVLAFCFFSFG